MSGSTLSMASVVESPVSFHRSHPAPDLLLLASPPSNEKREHRPTPKSHTTASSSSPAAATATVPPTASTLPLAAARNPSATASLPLPQPQPDQTLSSFPSFDLPLFDFDIGPDFDLSSLGNAARSAQNGLSKPAELPPSNWPDCAADDHVTDLASYSSEANRATGTASIPSIPSTSSIPSTPSIASLASIDSSADCAEASSLHTTSSPRLSITTVESLPVADLATAVASADQPGLAVPVLADKRRRKRDLIAERPRTWMIGSSRSAPNFRDLLKQSDPKDISAQQPGISPAHGNAKSTASASAVSVGGPLDRSEIVVERPRSSASFVDFARRSWKSRSPSPSPPSAVRKPSKSDVREDAGFFTAKLSRKRNNSITAVAEGNSADRGRSSSVSSNFSDASDVTIGSAHGSTLFTNGSANSSANASASPDGTTLASAAVVATTAPTSKPFSRASKYLTSIKSRPQSMFLRTGLNSNGQCDATDAAAADETENNRRANLDHDDGEGSDENPLPTKRLTLDLLTDSSPAGRKSSQTTESSGSSTDGSSANDSTALPASESESLTTADASHHNLPMAQNPASRDPLWIAFKDLESDFFNFLSKNTTVQRMGIVRASLLPFLRRHVRDTSNHDTKVLAPEDVERRTSILNRWWTALLEMLDNPGQWQNGDPNNAGTRGHYGSPLSGGTYFPTTTTTSGGNLHPVSGVDRPVVLEAVSMIMSRPEWRLLTPVFRPLADRPSGERARAGSDTPDDPPLDDASFLVEESVEHNVRTTFINNLMAQLALIVDKMAQRQVPMSIVNFSGRACAYAFFFVPGVADILVRLWGLEKNLDAIRRTADSFGLPRRSRGENEEFANLFPPCVGPLVWTSVNSVHAKLRRPPQINLLLSTSATCSRIPWYAPYWLSRWQGADTDLFFIFCKYYHLLADEFMPASMRLPLADKARAPAFVLLHAQMLSMLDNTIHRQAAVEAAMMAAPASDVLPFQSSRVSTANPDSFLPPLMMQQNLLRDMEENRIIALLKDFLTMDVAFAGARNTFASSLMVLLKAAACRTSQFNNNACYMLCDFLQETLQAFDTYYGYSNDVGSKGGAVSVLVDFVDWPFWIDVCRKMLESNNSMSEIRVLSFVFAVWDVIAADPVRKEQLCMGWLLTEDTFGKFFTNWCPMVRAYYMRLLCWRLCRDSGGSSELDTKIFMLVSQRMNTVWSHYLWLKQKADQEGSVQPSTAPSLPQPGKRFMIVRSEVNVAQPGLLANPGRTSRTNVTVAASFDALSNNYSSSEYSSKSNTAETSADDKKATSSAPKKRWSIFGKVLGMSSSATSGGKSDGDESADQGRRESTAKAFFRSRPSSTAGRLGSASSDSDSSTGSAPVFDSAQFVFRFMLHNIPWQGFGPMGAPGGIILPPAYRDRVLTHPRLPAPAQTRVSVRLSMPHKRTDSPAPASLAVPPVTRRVSGNVAGGLINDARNANPAEAVPDDDDSDQTRPSADSWVSANSESSQPRRSSFGFARDGTSAVQNEGWDSARSVSPFSCDSSRAEYCDEGVAAQPMLPKNHTELLRAKYAGKALAEWSIVVNECNSFVERRRDEGVFGLKDVEVPSLGIEGLRRMS